MTSTGFGINLKPKSSVALSPDSDIVRKDLSSFQKRFIPSILDLDGQSFWHHLSITEQCLFKRIRLNEFYNQGWNDKTSAKCKNLLKLIRWFNLVASGMATEILRHEDVKIRVEVMKKLISMADECLKSSNYNTCFEIVAGLNMAAISRLKNTWKALPKKSLDTWERLNQIVSNESIYAILTSRFLPQLSIGDKRGKSTSRKRDPSSPIRWSQLVRSHVYGGWKPLVLR
jgi:hypothetical protein